MVHRQLAGTDDLRLDPAGRGTGRAIAGPRAARLVGTIVPAQCSGRCVTPLGPPRRARLLDGIVGGGQELAGPLGLFPQLRRPRLASIRLQRRLRGADPRQAVLAAQKLGRQIRLRNARPQATIVRPVLVLSSGQQVADLGLQALLVLLHPVVAHRLVLARVRVDLRAVERDVAQLHEACPPSEPDDLPKEVMHGIQMRTPERADRGELRVLAACEVAECHVLRTGSSCVFRSISRTDGVGRTTCGTT